MINGRPLAIAMLATGLLPCWGCGLMPHTFQRLQPPAGLERARAVGRAPRDDDAPVTSALVGRLEDEDPVVRMTAGEELRRRTGQDFGFVAWARPEERALAVSRWRSYVNAPPRPAAPIATPAPPPAARQAARRPSRRRRARAQAPAATATVPPPSTSERMPS